MLLFNMPLFDAILYRVMQTDENQNSIDYEDVHNVFVHYFTKYEDTLGLPHPHIKEEQIRRIVAVMPFLDEEHTRRIDLKYYPLIIDRHFNTKYKNCDYNINHFFAGIIRECRYGELLLESIKKQKYYDFGGKRQ